MPQHDDDAGPGCTAARFADPTAEKRNDFGSPAHSLEDAQWISPHEPTPPPPGERPAYLLRRTFEWAPPSPTSPATEPSPRPQLQPQIRPHCGPQPQLTLHATAHGLYELYLNGVRLGRDELTPGFTSYRSRLDVQSIDVTGSLRPGHNTLVAVLSDGWFRGRHGFQRRAGGFGPHLALLAALRDETSGSTVMATDTEWESRASHITRADLMDGQTVDMRLLDRQWFTGADSGSRAWGPAIVSADPLCADRSRLAAPIGPRVRRLAEFAPTAITRPRPGTAVLDFGQNVNGWVRLTDLGSAGTHLHLTHGEVVDTKGLVSTENLRAFDFATGQLLPAGQVDEAISAGRPADEFEPRHTTHGFRYVQIDGVPEEDGRAAIELRTARAVLVGSDLGRTGEFDCSDPRLTQLHEVVRRSLTDNACSVPTDCPQRERSGFTGDWQIFARTAALMADVATFSRSWLRSLAADQWPDGRIPTIIPNPSGALPSGDPTEDMSAGSAGWGDAAAIVPWEMWRAYGDPSALAEAFPAMQNWVDYAASQAAGARHPDRAARRLQPAPHERYLWDTGFHFGEWLEPGVEPNMDPGVDRGIVATAYLARSAEIAAHTAALLDQGDVAERDAAVARGARDVWQREYLRGDGRIAEVDGAGERQAHYVRALAFGLVPRELEQPCADRLADLVHAHDDRLNTGFLATGLLLPVLADHGHADLAYRLLLRTGQPSWLGMLEAGATTMWERWDGIDAEGGAHGSLNHYSKGAVAAFLHTHAAGLRLPEFPGAGEAGYRHVRIAPVVGSGLTAASTRQETPLGAIEVAWRIASDRFELTLTIPEGCSAALDLPDGRHLDAVPTGRTRYEAGAGFSRST